MRTIGIIAAAARAGAHNGRRCLLLYAGLTFGIPLLLVLVPVCALLGFTILTAVADTPERVAEAHDNAAELRRTLARLPEPQARAVAMAGIYGMTAQQVADSEHVPLGTAKTRIRDGMQKLRAAYLPEEAGNE